jgi:hypothetical protein
VNVFTTFRPPYGQPAPAPCQGSQNRAFLIGDAGGLFPVSCPRKRGVGSDAQNAT